MLIRDQQTVARDERGAAAIVETDGRQAQVIEPGGGRVEPVPVAPLRSRGVVKGPHPLVGARLHDGEHDAHDADDERHRRAQATHVDGLPLAYCVDLLQRACHLARNPARSTSCPLR